MIVCYWCLDFYAGGGSPVDFSGHCWGVEWTNYFVKCTLNGVSLSSKKVGTIFSVLIPGKRQILLKLAKALFCKKCFLGWKVQKFPRSFFSSENSVRFGQRWANNSVFEYIQIVRTEYIWKLNYSMLFNNRIIFVFVFGFNFQTKCIRIRFLFLDRIHSYSYSVFIF